MKIDLKDEVLTISQLKCFDLGKSCSCGQAFRWGYDAADDCWLGVVRAKAVRAAQHGDTLRLFPCNAGDVDMWLDYFDLYRDYSGIEALISGSERLSVCLPCASGIRVFRQEPFETLISFIISANNNIKRISGIIERLCALCGERISVGGRNFFAFPSPEAISALSAEQLIKIGAGYRAPYILETAGRVAKGYCLSDLKGMNLSDARSELLRFKGVGPKVADCILLFSLGHTDAFPVDVWIGRAMSELYFNSETPTKHELESVVKSIGEYSGIIQQYIFYYARESRLGKA